MKYPLKLLLYPRKTGIISRTISWANRGPYSHCATVIGGQLYEYHWKQGGIKRFYDPEGVDKVAHIYVPKVERTNQEINQIRAFLEKHKDGKYDKLAILAFLTRATEESRRGTDKFTCSENQFLACRKGNLVLLNNIPAFAVSPTHVSWSPKIKRIQ